MAEDVSPEADAVSTVVLVGLPASGKSSIGRRLSKCLDRPFVDADVELVARSGLEIREWFSQRGEEAFRDAESDVLADLVTRPIVVGAGGGAVLRQTNRDLLRSSALVVWLRAEVPYLLSRVIQSGASHRPLLDGDPEEALMALAEQRVPLYAEVADIVIDVEPFRSKFDRPKVAMSEHLAVLIREQESR